MHRCYSRGGFRSGKAQLEAACRPRLVSARGAQALRNDDLLLARRLVRVRRELAATVALPRAEAELETAVIAVARVDRPVPAGLALRERIPDGIAVVGDDALGRRGGSRGNGLRCRNRVQR